jgi:putative acetyltransferase
MKIILESNPNPSKLKDLFTTTFTQSEGAEEGRLIGELAEKFIRETPKNDLKIYTAQQDETIIGAIYFSRFFFKDNPTQAFILSPVATHPDHQRQGIAQKLIQYAHDDLKDQGITLVITYGDIRFYQKVGYQQITEDIIKAPLPLSYPDGWLANSLTKTPLSPIKSETSCVPALADPRYW